ncbi:putative phosphoesterase PA-phosphatase [Candidatus Nitrosocosmicus arcticus]|uniref:Putative phosphoesterase PA-phosphatase n=2 Tax=Candidatus Nitrosocosmicus arcticus TaxID=2035267 RepID=A0A557SUG4_9ARCH|nr:putative phosphoesterase PA-phosphatase [Candidatus Nitrosocosmicus arcticus]
MVNKKIQIEQINPYWNIKISFIFLFLFIFVIMSVLAVTGITGNLDKIVTKFISQIRSQILDTTFIIITTTSDTINLIIVGFILTILKRTRRFGMILLITLVSVTILVTYIKPLFAIEHPSVDFKPLVILPDKFTLERDSFMPFAQDYSYPSNHIASAAAFSFIVGGLSYRNSPRFAIAFLIFFPVLIGFTKLYLFQHNFIDLVGGYFFGLVIVTIIVKALKANEEQRINIVDSNQRD